MQQGLSWEVKKASSVHKNYLATVNVCFCFTVAYLRWNNICGCQQLNSGKTGRKQCYLRKGKFIIIVIFTHTQYSIMY